MYANSVHSSISFLSVRAYYIISISLRCDQNSWSEVQYNNIISAEEKLGFPN